MENTTKEKRKTITYEKIKNDRFAVIFDNDLSLQSHEVLSISLPKYISKLKEIPIEKTNNFISDGFQWEIITIKFCNNIGASTAIKILEWLNLHSELTSGNLGEPTVYKKDIIINLLDPVQYPVSRWLLEGCTIVSVDFGECSYTDLSDNVITVVVQPDRCRILTNEIKDRNL